MMVREFADGCDVSQALLVREAEVRRRRDGGEFLRLTLGDRTGSVPAVVWEVVSDARKVCRVGEVVHATGRFSVHPRFGPQILVQAVREAAEHEYAREALMD